MESIDEAIQGMVSKSSGCNEGERTGDLENLKSRGRTHCSGRNYSGTAPNRWRTLLWLISASNTPKESQPRGEGEWFKTF